MLYKIKTGNGVPKLPQEDIAYLCCRFVELIASELKWCFTDGNAASTITEFYTNADQYDLLDWKSIHATEWSDNNNDADHDRVRKKHAEFLVKDHLPVKYIRAIVVFNELRQRVVQEWVNGMGLDVRITSNKPNYYFT